MEVRLPSLSKVTRRATWVYEPPRGSPMGRLALPFDHIVSMIYYLAVPWDFVLGGRGMREIDSRNLWAGIWALLSWPLWGHHPALGPSGHLPTQQTRSGHQFCVSAAPGARRQQWGPAARAVHWERRGKISTEAVKNTAQDDERQGRGGLSAAGTAGRGCVLPGGLLTRHPFTCVQWGVGKDGLVNYFSKNNVINTGSLAITPFKNITF